MPDDAASKVGYAYYEQVAKRNAQHGTVEAFLDLTESCFKMCVHNFTTSVLTQGEKKCISQTAQKYAALSKRVSERFVDAQKLALAGRAASADAALAETEKTIAELQGGKPQN